MNITKEQIDALNAVVKVAVTKADYQDKVETILKDYRKQANIPGFRKGQVPMGLIKKQYGKAVLVDEVNKLIQENLNKFLTEEKLDVLGNPLPKQQDNFDWDQDDFDFEFELGLAPDFVAKQYGKLVSKEVASKKDEISGTFSNEEESIDNKATLEVNKLNDEKALVGKKAGDVVVLKTKDLLKEAHLLASTLGVDAEKAKDLDTEVKQIRSC